MDRYVMLPFWLAEQRLAVTLDQVVRVLPALQVSPLPGAPEAVCGLVNVRGKLLPVVDLARRFGWATPVPGLWQPFIWLRSSVRELLLPVARVESVCSAAAEDFIPAPDPRVPSSLLRGALRTDQGLLLIQDVEQMLSAGDELQLAALLSDDGRLADAAD